MAGFSLRQYDPRDADAVWALHEWAMAATGTDPADIPGTEDLRNVEATYLDSGGEFLVGILPAAPETFPETGDGAVAAMGGFLPSEVGHDDERTVPGAAELHRMRVAPPCQGEGYGRQLLAELETRATAAGFEAAVATTARGNSVHSTFMPQRATGLSVTQP